MATKQLAHDDPGQFSIYLTDFRLETRHFNPLQVVTLMDAILYEWQFGYAPSELAWRGLGNAKNQHQISQIDELRNSYDSLPCVRRMREKRLAKLSLRSKANDATTEVGTHLPTRQGNTTASDAKPNVINETAPKKAGESTPSSSSTSSSLNTSVEENYKGDKNKAVSVAPTVHAVFAYWQATLKHPDAKLIAKREKVVSARLKEGYTLEQLKLAIDGCKASPWHQGQNDRRTVFDDLELICRDGGQVEKFIAIAQQPAMPQTRSPNGWQQSKTAGNEAAAEEAIRRMEARINASGTDETIYQITNGAG